MYGTKHVLKRNPKENKKMKDNLLMIANVAMLHNEFIPFVSVCVCVREHQMHILLSLQQGFNGMKSFSLSAKY